MTAMLDRDRPYGQTAGDDKVSFKQDGFDFDSTGKIISGSLNSGKKTIAEAAPVSVAVKPVYEDMHIQALKRHASLVYARMEAANLEFEPIPSGTGMQARLIEFLNDHG